MEIGSILSTAVHSLQQTSQAVAETADRIVNVHSGIPDTNNFNQVSGGGPLLQQLPTNADLVQEQVNLIQAEHSYKAALKLVEVDEELGRTLLDLKG